jgi:MFS transporter, SET family, sugar efflux transporter
MDRVRVPAVLADPVYRAFSFILLLKGLALGAALPFLALWLTNDLHATLRDVGLLRTASGVVTLGWALLAARVTDRTSRRRAWIIGTLLLEGTAWLLLTQLTAIGIAIAVATLGNLSALALLFASLADWTAERRSPGSGSVQSTVRMFFSLGWLVGPALGGLLMSLGGAKALFALTGSVTLLAAAVAARSLADAPRQPRPERATEGRTRGRELVIFCVALGLAFGADGATRTTLLPVYLTDALGVSLPSYGVMLTVAIVLELPAFVVAGRLADRFGTARVVGGGLLALALTSAMLAAFPRFWAVVAAEGIRVVYVAAVHGCAMIHLQRLLPGRSGLAMALYATAFQLAPAIAAPLLSVASTRLGWAPTFALCGLLAFTALVLALAGGGAPEPEREVASKA